MIELINRVQPYFSSHILLYHSTFTHIPDNLKEGLHNVTPNNIYKQVSWLKRYFDIVELDELFTQSDILGKVAITFDDAYQSVFEEALPILESLNVPSTIFINGSSLDNKVFWRDKIRFLLNGKLIDDFLKSNQYFLKPYGMTSQNFYKISKQPTVNSQILDNILDNYLEQRGVSLDNFCINSREYIKKSPLVMYGNHTYNHYLLSSLNMEQQELEIGKNHQLLKTLDVKLSKVFSIPFGGDKDFNTTTIQLLKKYNYIGFLYSKNALNLKKNQNRDKSLISKERYMVNSEFNTFQKQIFKLALKGWLK